MRDYHVVGGSKIVDVTFIDGNRYIAKVVGTDAYNDIAVVQITDNITQSLKPLVIGNSSKLEVGDPVIAVGNPFGLSDTHKSVGHNVIFTVYRNGHILNLKTTLAARPSTPGYP